MINEMVRDSFKSIISYKVPEEVNEILYCFSPTEQDTKQQKNKLSKIDAKHPILQGFRLVNDQVKNIRMSARKKELIQDKVNADEEFLDLADSLKSLKVV